MRKILENVKPLPLEDARELVYKELARLSNKQARAKIITKDATKEELIIILENLLHMTNNNL